MCHVQHPTRVAQAADHPARLISLLNGKRDRGLWQYEIPIKLPASAPFLRVGEIEHLILPLFAGE